MRVAVHYQGRVQGVGFRASTQDLARRLPLTGFVRNEPDGSVHLEAQGDDAAIDLLRSRVRERLGRYIHSETPTPIPEVPDESAFVIAR